MAGTLTGSICLLCGGKVGEDNVCGNCGFDHEAGDFIGGATGPMLEKLRRIREESAAKIHGKPTADGDDIFCDDSPPDD